MKKIKEFTPNYITHQAFGEALQKAEKSGVKILAYDCIVTPDTLKIDAPIKVRLI
jgi:sugar fermentation stimulation protein A